MTNKVKVTSIAQIIMAILIVGLKYLALWIEGFVALFILMFVFVITMALGLSIGLRILTIFRTKKASLVLTPLFGILSVIVVFFDPIEYLIEKNKSPILFSGYCEHTMTNVSFVFRKDSTFEYEAGAFLGSDSYHGKYSIKYDTVYLEFVKEPQNIKATLFLGKNWFEEVGDTSRHSHVFKYHMNNIGTLQKIPDKTSFKN